MFEKDLDNFCMHPNRACSILLSIAASIAHEEDALACILSAECAKIEKVLERSCELEDLIAIDTSVQETIENITVLEGILKAKLDALIPLLRECM